jgi:hypothetical protein
LLKQVNRRGTNNDKNVSRVREVEEKTKNNRIKSRGRNILTDAAAKATTPQTESIQESDDEGLGGCKHPLCPTSSTSLHTTDEGFIFRDDTVSIFKRFESSASIYPCDMSEEWTTTGVASSDRMDEEACAAFNFGLATPPSTPPKSRRSIVVDPSASPQRLVPRKFASMPRRRTPHFSSL